jgi:hypothetical protein
MTLDTEEDRAILLELINKALFPGTVAETVSDLKRRIAEAGVAAGAEKALAMKEKHNA